MITIVYVSLNKPHLVVDSLKSIFKYNIKYKYEAILVAYLFSNENLKFIRRKLPFLRIIESNEIRGFAENNNLALREVKTQLSLILNDDTFVKDNSIDLMVDKFIETKVKILSPKILYPDGKLQFMGRPKFNALRYILFDLNLIKRENRNVGSEIFFPIYGISGACFLIETNFFKNMGFFNEAYFFTPEDVEVGHKAFLSGHSAWIYLDANVYHIASSTASKIHQITIPVAKKGVYKYLKSNFGIMNLFLYKLFVLSSSIFKFIYWSLKKDSDRSKIMKKAWGNVLKYSFTSMTPKEIFIKEYTLLTKNK